MCIQVILIFKVIHEFMFLMYLMRRVFCFFLHSLCVWSVGLQCGLAVFLSFFGLEDPSRQANHWTKLMVSTRLTTEDPRNCSGPEDNGSPSF